MLHRVARCHSYQFINRAQKEKSDPYKIHIFNFLLNMFHPIDLRILILFTNTKPQNVNFNQYHDRTHLVCGEGIPGTSKVNFFHGHYV
jgi:hypothetical protein